jgi:glycerophosphoryl diester phosphodiesterase
MHIYGHRGAAGEAPENTIAGCRHAIERGVRRIEIDLQLSADQQIVICHDKTLNRNFSTSGKVSDYSARELNKFDGRADGPPWPNKKNTGAPTLEKLLEATPEIEHYQLEVKPGKKEAMDKIAHLLAERFDTAKNSKKVVITSSNTTVLKYLANYAPHLQRGIVATKITALQAAINLKLDFFCLNWTLCNPFLIAEIKRRKLKASVWTVNDLLTIKNLHKMKVHSIITDYPSMAIPYVGSLERE